MTIYEFRDEMIKYWHSVDAEATRLKEPYFALWDMYSLYEKFDESERYMADLVLSEWVLSDDEKMRFDALALVYKYKIRAAEPALKELAARLTSSREPGAPFELEKVLYHLSSLNTN